MAGNDIVCSVESGASYIVIFVITTGSKFFLINRATLYEKRVGKKTGLTCTFLLQKKFKGNFLDF